MKDQYQQGYEAQTEWLRDKTVADLRAALAAREATVQPSPYNQGGTDAIRDHMRALIIAES